MLAVSAVVFAPVRPDSGAQTGTNGPAPGGRHTHAASATTSCANRRTPKCCWRPPGDSYRPAESARWVARTNRADRRAAKRQRSVPEPHSRRSSAAPRSTAAIKNIYNASRTVGGVGIRRRRVRRRLGPLRGVACPSDRDLLQLRRTHRPHHHVQHRRLARREHQLRRGSGQRRRRHQSTPSSSSASTNWHFWLSPLPPLPPIVPPLQSRRPTS